MFDYKYPCPRIPARLNTLFQSDGQRQDSLHLVCSAEQCGLLLLGPLLRSFFFFPPTVSLRSVYKSCSHDQSMRMAPGILGSISDLFHRIYSRGTVAFPSLVIDDRHSSSGVMQILGLGFWGCFMRDAGFSGKSSRARSLSRLGYR